MNIPTHSHSGKTRLSVLSLLAAIAINSFASLWPSADASEIGLEVAVTRHLADGEEFTTPLHKLIAHGKLLFNANWTIQEGGGRPFTTGTGAPLDRSSPPLVFPRNFNRISAPDANACGGCHNMPRSGGGGDQVANVFVLGQRFEFVTFDNDDMTPIRSSVDESRVAVDLQTVANERNTLGMFGSGFIEMLARQITADLQRIRDALGPGQAAGLMSKGIEFGMLVRDGAGAWDTSGVKGLPATSLKTSGPDDPPSLIIRPFHQAGAVVSVREFTNNAFNHHHGIQSTERFGNIDLDGDGFANELTRADVTAAVLYQATLAVPGRVIPNDPDIEAAVWLGEQTFTQIGCADCHIPSLPLDDQGWIYTEPNPYNPDGNLQVGEAPTLAVDLTWAQLDSPRLKRRKGVLHVPAYTDLKLHDITSGPGDPNCEPLDMLQPGGSPGFFAGNCSFLTRKLWGVASEPPYFHHGKFTTLRQAVEAHHGEAESAQENWQALSDFEKDATIEFLKSLQVLPEDSEYLIVDENGHRKKWPPAW